MKVESVLMRSRRHLGALPLLLLPQLGCECLTEVLRLEEWADLDVRLLARHRIRAPFHPFDGLFERTNLPDPKAGDELLCFRERTVDHASLRAAEVNAFAGRAWLEPIAGEHDPGLYELFVERAHLLEHLGVGDAAGLGILARFDDHHDAHCRVLLWLTPCDSDGRFALGIAGSLIRRTEPDGIDTRNSGLEVVRQTVPACN